MNIYFLVEGQSSEAEVYPAWLSHLVPELIRVDNFDEVHHNNYYLFNSYGIPYIENDILNAIQDINSLGSYCYFVICIDADSATVNQREAKIIRLMQENQIVLSNNTSLKIIVQNRCIETWFLGNRRVYSRNPQNNLRFIEYSSFYNVSQNDPELMGKPQNFDGSISKFHLAYLKAMFNERGNMTYSKSNSLEVQRITYLNELIQRTKDGQAHLQTLNNFFGFCNKIRREINS